MLEYNSLLIGGPYQPSLDEPGNGLPMLKPAVNRPAEPALIENLALVPANAADKAAIISQLDTSKHPSANEVRSATAV
jgi:hypothetical protein